MNKEIEAHDNEFLSNWEKYHKVLDNTHLFVTYRKSILQESLIYQNLYKPKGYKKNLITIKDRLIKFNEIIEVLETSTFRKSYACSLVELKQLETKTNLSPDDLKQLETKVLYAKAGIQDRERQLEYLKNFSKHFKDKTAKSREGRLKLCIASYLGLKVRLEKLISSTK